MYGHPGNALSEGGGAFLGKNRKVMLSFGQLMAVNTFVVTIGLATLCLILWGFASAWHSIAWAITLFGFYRWCRKMVRAYKEGRNG